MFKKEGGNWIRYRELQGVLECDFHKSDDGPREMDYDEAMGEVDRQTLLALIYAQAKGFRYVLFTHGWSTSRPGITTARSIVRSVMRSRLSTPYINKNQSIQHESVFVAAIKPGNISAPKGAHHCAGSPYHIGTKIVKIPIFLLTE